MAPRAIGEDVEHSSIPLFLLEVPNRDISVHRRLPVREHRPRDVELAARQRRPGPEAGRALPGHDLLLEKLSPFSAQR